MKTLLYILVLLIIGACSKNNSSSTKSDQIKLDKANYLVVLADEEAVYNSSEVTLIEVGDDSFTFVYGLANVYSQNTDGTPRAGNHPEPEFKIQVATYKLKKDGDKINLIFEESSCKDKTKNPFSSLIPNSIELSQLSDSLKVKLAGTDVIYPKDVDGRGDALMDLNVVRVLCEGESND